MRGETMRKTSFKMLSVLIALIILGISFTGCTREKEEIKLGAQNVNELIILINMAKLLIEDQTDYEVAMNTEFTGSSVLHQAMLENEIDIYPTWTGTQLTGILRYEGEKMSQEETHNYVKQEFEEQFNMTWSEPFGFNNTYAFVVKDEIAQEYKLEKASDLADYASDWLLAGDENFDSRADAYPGWSKAYGIEFAEVLNMQYGLIYRSIDAGEVDVAAAYSTDSRIEELGLTILEDDKEFFPDYSGAYVISQGLQENYPEVIDILNKLGGTINNEQMVEMNFRYDNGEDPDIIAKDFLNEAGLL